MTSAEGRRIEAPNGVGHGEGCPLPSQLEGLGERRELPAAGNTFWNILKVTERSFLQQYAGA